MWRHVTLQIATDILQEAGLSSFRVEPVGLYPSKYMTSHPVDCNSHILPLICKPTQSFEQNIFSFPVDSQYHDRIVR
jgi:hypothetical protein